MPKPKNNTKKPSTKKPAAKPKLHRRIRHQFIHWFVPTAHNYARPRLQRSFTLIALLVLVLIVQFVYNTTTRGRVLGSNADITSANLLAFTNTMREQDKKPTLSYNEKLAHAAEMKAQDMFAQQYWSHNAPDGSRPWKWLSVVEYSYTEAGENLARGFDSAEAIVNAWMNSPSHRENVLKPVYSEVGFAAVDGTLGGKQTTLVVALYAQPSNEPAVMGTASENHMFLATVEESTGFWVWLKRGIKSATPSLIFLLALLSLASVVTLLAHAYRRHLPPELKKSWYRHHAVYKLIFLVVLAIGTIMSYGGGMI